MKYYEVTGPKATFSAGTVLGLTPEQSASRAHKLAFIEEKDGLKLYRANGPVEFKAGEILATASDVNKFQLSVLDESSGKLHALHAAKVAKKEALKNQPKPEPVKLGDEGKKKKAVAPPPPATSAKKTSKKAGK